MKGRRDPSIVRQAGSQEVQYQTKKYRNEKKSIQTKKIMFGPAQGHYGQEKKIPVFTSKTIKQYKKN